MALLLFLLLEGGTISAAAASPDAPLKNRRILPELRGSSASYIIYTWPANQGMGSNPILHPAGLVRVSGELRDRTEFWLVNDVGLCLSAHRWMFL